MPLWRELRCCTKNMPKDAFRKGQEGVEEGREVMEMEWRSWLERRDEALAAGKRFDEPPPNAKTFKNGR